MKELKTPPIEWKKWADLLESFNKSGKRSTNKKQRTSSRHNFKCADCGKVVKT